MQTWQEQRNRWKDVIHTPYTSYVRGVEIDFSPENIRRVMRFKEETPGTQHNYHHRRPTNEELNEVFRDLCEEGATWKMGKGRDPKPIQLRRPELTNLARGWQEFIIHNLLPTGNKSEITVARAMPIHSIIRGDEIIAEEIIADNISLITQGLGGKGKLVFPSTIYKLCKAAKVRMGREYRGYGECEEGRYITKEVMEMRTHGFSGTSASNSACKILKYMNTHIKASCGMGNGLKHIKY
ncbi:hypothetical protein PIB30_046018 [Stylosanthes scabra]|uniref:Putative plant transposon protein domain-containing protein n=1 Tax=Stylosanthes scabra TaxID=79078 RepID=A0ABU6WEF7_9FABA|nr:hypothetical protein [Stylosanthes scabra]